MDKEALKFIQSNSPDGGFLQSEYWWKFQESVGRKTFHISETGEDGTLIASANILEHELPIVGSYFYIPRGPVFENFKFEILNLKSNLNEKNNKLINDLINLARKNNIGWIRIEPNSESDLEIIRNIVEIRGNKLKVVKSGVDMQPREILVMDISKSEEEILAGMKQKTRYNVRLAEKRGVHVTCNTQHVTQKNIEEFIKLVKITSERDRITPHSESYYRKMFEIIPPDVLKLYVAEYEGKVIAANLVLFFGKTATYMHGASDNVHRDAMAPYLLQWQAILDAKKVGCTMYDFGGVRTQPHPSPLPSKSAGRLIKERENPWEGITRFKTGFSPETKTIQFPGSYDIILNTFKYNLYRILQRIRRAF
jgi:peptidoglycan pentaglycine glycine transferase (the first glycine)